MIVTVIPLIVVKKRLIDKIFLDRMTVCCLVTTQW